MEIAFACDHGGYPRKEPILNHLKEKGYEVLDFGTDSEDSCHYPAFALPASEAIRDHKADKGIFVCSSGEGVARAANKVKGILAGIGYNDEVSHLIVEHNHANVITFAAYLEDNSAKKFRFPFVSVLHIGHSCKTSLLTLGIFQVIHIG